MPFNPLDTIKEESILLKLFDNIIGESRYVDLFNFILEQEKDIKQQIYKNTDKCVKWELNYEKNDIIIVELNKLLKPMKLKCTVDNLSCKEINMRFKSNIEPMYEMIKIFEVKTNSERSEKSCHFKRIIPKKDKQLTIIEDNNYFYVPTLEIVEYSGILAELNSKLKSVNLSCSVEKRSCLSRAIAMLRFEPDFRCNICWNIYDTEHELKKHVKEHEEEHKKYIQETIRISKETEEKLQKERDKINKARDRTR